MEGGSGSLLCFISISLMINDVELFFPLHVLIRCQCIFFGEMSVQIFNPFKKSDCLSYYYFVNSLQNLDMSPYQILQIFSLNMWLAFSLFLKVYFEEQKFKISISPIYYFQFMVCALCPKTFCLAPNHKDSSSVLFQKFYGFRFSI